MNDIVNLIVNNSVSVVVVAYFLYMNYKFNDKLVDTLARIDEKLERSELFNEDNKPKRN